MSGFETDEQVKAVISSVSSHMELGKRQLCRANATSQAVPTARIYIAGATAENDV